MSLIQLGQAERRYIVGGAEANVRSDGRQRHEHRRVQIELGVVAQATGSARVRIGGSDVIVCVKAEIGAPDDDRPDAGRVLFSVECSPVASPAFRGRGGDELSSEIARALERSMHDGPGALAGGSAPLDASPLCIVPGKTCWVLHVDALVLDLDGAALDAVSIGVKSALHDTRIPRVEVVQGEDPGDEPEYEVDDDPEAAVRLDISKVPLSLTVCQLGSALILDPTGEEEEAAGSGVAVAMDRSGQVCGVTKRRTKGMQPLALMEVLALAQREGRRLHAALDGFLSSVPTSMQT
jgi:exosome complex component RRP42